MNNPLVLEIAKLYDLIETSENERNMLVNNNAHHSILQHVNNNIEMLKKRVQVLEDMLLDDSLNNQL